MISLQNFSYQYAGADRFALNEINLEIETGEFVVLTGPSGCGKSSLALAIAGILFQQYEGEASGAIRVQGKDVLNTPVYQTAADVGLVQQNPEAQFCTLTVEDEVAFGLENRCVPRADILVKVDSALEAVGALHLRSRELATLSGGEKQRVAIAAVIAADPSVLIFDEPTSNLDPAATAEIFAVIADIRSRKALTVLVIEHKLAFLRPFQPRTLLLEDGQLVMDGQLPSPSTPASQRQRSTPPLGNSQHPAAVIRNLSVRRDGMALLDNISADIHAGEFISVMGENGSGKTTFLHCLLGLLRADDGSVTIFDQDAAAAPISRLARDAGFVFQNPDHQLFGDTVWDEAVLAPSNFGLLSEDSSQAVDRLLSQCGLQGRKQDHPYRLSYGQKRRLNLVSILSYHPRLLLMD